MGEPCCRAAKAEERRRSVSHLKGLSDKLCASTEERARILGDGMRAAAAILEEGQHDYPELRT